MCCGATGPGLVIRLGESEMPRVLSRPYVRPLNLTGRPLRGFVFVSPRRFSGDRSVSPSARACGPDPTPTVHYRRSQRCACAHVVVVRMPPDSPKRTEHSDSKIFVYRFARCRVRHPARALLLAVRMGPKLASELSADSATGRSCLGVADVPRITLPICQQTGSRGELAAKLKRYAGRGDVVVLAPAAAWFHRHLEAHSAGH